MVDLIWTEPALADLQDIAAWIALDKPIAAKRFVRKVFEEVELLRKHPHLGSMPKELRGTRYRHLIISPVRIFYRQEGSKIYLVHVMRGERRFRVEDFEE